MESLQTLSARVLAKNNFDENFFHKKKHLPSGNQKTKKFAIIRKIQKVMS